MPRTHGVKQPLRSPRLSPAPAVSSASSAQLLRQAAREQAELGEGERGRGWNSSSSPSCHLICMRHFLIPSWWAPMSVGGLEFTEVAH